MMKHVYNVSAHSIESYDANFGIRGPSHHTLMVRARGWRGGHVVTLPTYLRTMFLDTLDM